MSPAVVGGADIPPARANADDLCQLGRGVVGRRTAFERLGVIAARLECAPIWAKLLIHWLGSLIALVPRSSPYEATWNLRVCPHYEVSLLDFSDHDSHVVPAGGRGDLKDGSFERGSHIPFSHNEFQHARGPRNLAVGRVVGKWSRNRSVVMHCFCPPLRSWRVGSEP